MKININGDLKEIIKDPFSIGELIELQNVESPDMLSVQLNGSFVERASFKSTFLNDGDSVDFLYFMGGGRFE
jgi:sulfur carrier protein